MKIIYSSDARIPSTEANSIHVMKMSQSFGKLSDDVELIAIDTEDALDSDPYKFYGVKKSFAIKKIGKIPKVKGRMYLYGYKASRYIIKRKPRFVYGRSIFIGLFLAIHNKINFGIELHNPIGSASQERAFKYMLKKKSLKKIVVISEELKRYYQKRYNIKPNRIMVAPDAADIVEVIPNNDLKLVNQDNGFNIGYIGHLYKGKGMEIISQLAKQLPDCNFHIVGGTSEDIEHWKKVTTKCKNIYYYGYVPHSETTQYGALFDIVLAPYMNKVYGARNNTSMNLSQWMSPLKLFEYMSLGKPIITSNLPVIREILNDGETAFLCDSKNISQWVEAIKYCMNNKEKAKLIGLRAKDKFEKKYTWDIRAKNIYNEMIKR